MEHPVEIAPVPEPAAPSEAAKVEAVPVHVERCLTAGRALTTIVTVSEKRKARIIAYNPFLAVPALDHITPVRIWCPMPCYTL